MANDTMEQALEQCWRRLQEGVPVDECIQAFPQYAAELREMLMLTLKYSNLTQAPSEEFRTRSLRRTLVAAQKARAGAGRRRGGFSLPTLRWVAAPVAALVLLLAGGEFAWATADALPGTPLYPVKEAREQASVLLTRGQPLPNAEVQTDLSEKRLNELQRMVEAPEHLARVPAVMQKTQEQLTQAIEAAGNAQGGGRRAVLARLIQVMNRADQQLQALEANPRTQNLPEVQRMRQRLETLKERIRSMFPAGDESRPAQQRPGSTR